MKEFNIDRHGKQPKGRSQAKMESHHIESQTRAQRYIGNYRPLRAPTMLLKILRHKALTKDQIKQMRQPGFNKKIGTARALKQARQLLVKHGVPKLKATLIALEHDRYMKATTKLHNVDATRRAFRAQKSRASAVKEHAKQLEKGGASKAEAARQALQRDGERKGSTPLSQVKSRISRFNRLVSKMKPGPAGNMFKRGASKIAQKEWSQGGDPAPQKSTSGQVSKNGADRMFKRGASKTAMAEWAETKPTTPSKSSGKAAGGLKSAASKAGALLKRNSVSGKPAASKPAASKPAASKPASGKSASGKTSASSGTTPAARIAPLVKAFLKIPPSKI